MSDVFLLDSDVLISSYRLHHPFSYKEFHPFWRWLERLAEHGKAELLDSVYKEVTRADAHGNEDELARWAEAVFAHHQVSHKTDSIGDAYAHVQNYLVECGCYQPVSYAQWEPEDKADPWLIATAMVLPAVIVTNEQAAKPTPVQPLKKEPKIPDVAQALGVRTIGLRDFYDESGELTAADYSVQPTL